MTCDCPVPGCFCHAIVEPRTAPSKAPPLGLMPRRIWEQRRVAEILMAMQRYNDAGMEFPDEWQEELADLTWRARS